MVVIGAINWQAAAAMAAVAAVAVTALGLVYSMKRAARADGRDVSQDAHATRDVAREEAMELADVRGKAMGDLHREVAALRTEVAQERDAHLEAVGRLQAALDLSRDQALETQQMLAHGMRGLLVWLLSELEQEPPRVDKAVKRIREALADSDPRPPGQRRVA